MNLKEVFRALKTVGSNPPSSSRKAPEANKPLFRDLSSDQLGRIESRILETLSPPPTIDLDAGLSDEDISAFLDDPEGWKDTIDPLVLAPFQVEQPSPADISGEPSTRFGITRRTAIGFVLSTLILAGTILGVGSAPGSVLYPIRLANEDLQVRFASPGIERAGEYLSIAGVRLEFLQDRSLLRNAPLLIRVLGELDAAMVGAFSGAVSAPSGQQRTGMLGELLSLARTEQELLGRMSPSGSPMTDMALNNSIRIASHIEREVSKVLLPGIPLPSAMDDSGLEIAIQGQKRTVGLRYGSAEDFKQAPRYSSDQNTTPATSGSEDSTPPEAPGRQEGQEECNTIEGRLCITVPSITLPNLP